jgi:hypothetical protein
VLVAQAGGQVWVPERDGACGGARVGLVAVALPVARGAAATASAVSSSPAGAGRRQAREQAANSVNADPQLRGDRPGRLPLVDRTVAQVPVKVWEPQLAGALLQASVALLQPGAGGATGGLGVDAALGQRLVPSGRRPHRRLQHTLRSQLVGSPKRGPNLRVTAVAVPCEDALAVADAEGLQRLAAQQPERRSVGLRIPAVDQHQMGHA